MVGTDFQTEQRKRARRRVGGVYRAAGRWIVAARRRQNSQASASALRLVAGAGLVASADQPQLNLPAVL